MAAPSAVASCNASNNDNFDSDYHINGNGNDEVVDDDDRETNDNVAFELSEEARNSIPGEIEVVHHSVEQRVHVELLQLLDNVGAPDYMFSEVIDWASRAKALNYTFNPVLTSRAAVLTDLKKHFNMEKLNASVRDVKLELIAKKVPVVSFEFKSQLVSLLTDMSLM
jgi:hypothetical protein